MARQLADFSWTEARKQVNCMLSALSYRAVEFSSLSLLTSVRARVMHWVGHSALQQSARPAHGASSWDLKIPNKTNWKIVLTFWRQRLSDDFLTKYHRGRNHEQLNTRQQNLTHFGLDLGARIKLRKDDSFHSENLTLVVDFAENSTYLRTKPTLIMDKSTLKSCSLKVKQKISVFFVRGQQV